ncbi:sigma-70 family RNA polymerase sigma factor [soil metagenome]
MNEFLAEWTPRLYRFAIRLTGDAHAAEDLTQEAMLRAWGQRSSLRDESALRAWLFRIAANLWRDQLRRRRSPVARASELPESVRCAAASPERVASGRDELQMVLRQLDQLPPRQRESLYLSACEGMKAVEIAGILDVSPEAIKASLSIARKRMRELFAEASTTKSAGGLSQ